MTTCSYITKSPVIPESAPKILCYHSYFMNSATLLSYRNHLRRTTQFMDWTIQGVPVSIPSEYNIAS